MDPVDDDFDESILNQPWDPVSYFEEESGGEIDNGALQTGSSPGTRLSELFETNLRSVENDLKKMAMRKESQDKQDLMLEKNFDGEEFGDSIERFITYEDEEDHLKAFDNTVMTNQKNINSDMKRLAHFKQNSIQEGDDINTKEHYNENNIGSVIKKFTNFKQNSIDEESEFISKGYQGDVLSNDYVNSRDVEKEIEQLVDLLPDAVQEEPVEIKQNADVNAQGNMLNGFVGFAEGRKSEIDIDLLLPDVVSDDPSEIRTEHSAHSVDYDAHSVDYDAFAALTKTQVKLADKGSKGDNADVIDYATLFGIGNINTLDASLGSSQDSVNEVIEAAEKVVIDYASKDSTGSSLHEDKHSSDHHFIEENTKPRDLINNQNLLIDLDDVGNQDRLVISSQHNCLDPDIIRFSSHGTANFDLLERFDDNIISKADTSLHDELTSVSPGLDFQEPSFGNDGLVGESFATTSHNEELMTEEAVLSLEEFKSAECSPVVELRTTEVKRKRKKKLKRQNYLVDILSNTDSDSESSSKSPEIGLISDTHANDKLVTASLVSEEPAQTEASQHQSGVVGKTCEAAEQHGGAGCVNMEASKGADAVNESEIPEECDVDAITRQISEQFADEILNEVDIEVVESQSHAQSIDDTVFSEEQGAVSVHSLLPENTDFVTEQPHADSELTRMTRTGSTSDSEELEEFIDQQLREGAMAPSLEPPSLLGATSLPPISEEIQLGWYAPKWVPDKDAKICMNCDLKFTVVKRRHHCRACGKVLCSNCCNMKADLAYLGYKASRVCQECYEILSKGQTLSPLPLMTGNQDVPGRGHTISLNSADIESAEADTPPQYMPGSPPEYSVVPGTAIQSGPPNPPSYFASSGRESGFRNRTESDRSVVIMFNSSQTDLPPILKIANEVVKIINNPNLKSVFQQIKDPTAEPVAFLVNKNLVVKLKIVSLECCIGKQCLCFSSDGMGASNQEEIVFLVEYTSDDHRLLKCIFQQFNAIFERAKHGEPLSEFGFVTFDEYMMNNRKNVGMLLFKPNVQCVQNITVPCHPYLFGLWVQQTEVPWAKNLPLRLLVRLGAEFKSYPYPVYNLPDRDPVFQVVGRTIIGLLADFTSFQYTLPRISGLLVSLTKKDTTIKLPQTRYDEVLKVLNTSEESVMAFSGNFNKKADSHLVCVENDGTHTTQSISCRTSSKKLTSCSFVVFSAALKMTAEQTLEAKTSIVEDGIIVQVTSHTMKKIRSSMKEMQDLIITQVGQETESSTELNKLKIVWGSSDDSSTRISSPIDGSSFDGLTNMRIRHSYDFTVSTSPAKIHWQEVYFLPNDADTVGRLSAKDLSQMTSSVAKACMNALSPHLSTLAALEMTKIGLRMILDSDMVEYRIGANNEQLPQELTGDLDDKLIPVIHSVMKTVSHRRVSAELIFQITRIV